MQNHLDCYQKVKKKCFDFITSQETKKEKFKNKEKMVKSFTTGTFIYIVIIMSNLFSIICYD